jgi:arylsulfatase A-like enzyme
MNRTKPTRREVLKSAAALGVATAMARMTRLSGAEPAAAAPVKPGAPKYNVLFIMSDDMRPELSLYGNPLVAAPNLAALAKQGVLFERGFCQYPLCCPSRSSMLTGRQPINTGVLGNRTWFGDVHPEFVSLPKYFKQQGYVTARTGKIFHGGIDDTEAWTVGGEARSLAGTGAGDSDAASSAPAPKTGAPETDIAKHNLAAASNVVNGQRLTAGQYSDREIVLEGNGEGHGDYACADRAIAYLQQYKDQPFFIGCGFVKPHSPPTAPQKFYDQIDMTKLQLPVDFAARRTLPEGFPEGCLRPHNADLFIGRDATVEEAKKVTQAYLASIAWVDWNIGRVLAELDRLGLREKTIVCFLADHGYQLGEKGKWSKAGSLWEEGARVPMIISAPQAKGNGQTSTRIVQSLNFYPTLVELCGLPMPAGQEGTSMVPLLNDPKATWDHPAYTVWSEDGKTLTGIGVRVEGWRYADYVLGGPMLLDMTNDPHQLKNLVHDPKHADIAAKMAALVQKYKDSGKQPAAATAAA